MIDPALRVPTQLIHQPMSDANASIRPNLHLKKRGGRGVIEADVFIDYITEDPENKRTRISVMREPLPLVVHSQDLSPREADRISLRIVSLAENKSFS